MSKARTLGNFVSTGNPLSDGTIAASELTGTLPVANGGTGVTTSTGTGNVVLSASPTLTGDVTLNAQGDLRFADADSSNWVAFQAPATVASNVTWTLPAADGTSSQVLSTNGSGTLSWATAGGGGGGGSGTSTSRTSFTATASQTTFTVSYVVGQIDVYMNGSKLLIGTDVTASSGTNIVLASGAAAGDIIEAVVYSSQLITSGSDLYYTAGKLGVGTSTFTSGGGKLQVSDGITFPATQSASTDANTLDDYEEGTWTPTVSSSSGTLTSYTSSGKYTKIGRSVTVSFIAEIVTTGTASGTMRIDSFPFTDGNSMQIATLAREQSTGTAYQAFKRNGDTAGHIRTLTEGSIVWTAGQIYQFGLTYFV